MTDLLPCPFCGNAKPGMASSIDATDWGVLCGNCGASCSTTYESAAEAIASWNMRAGDAQAPSNDEIKLTYIKRWRTIVKLPAKYADEIVKALRDPAQAPPEYPDAPLVCAELYQVIGYMAFHYGIMEHPDVQKALDNASQHKLVHTDLLPWPKQDLPALVVSSTDQSAPPADVRAALEKLVEAARQMPRQTPGPGGAATGHHYVLTAGAVWGLDRAINAAVSALSSTNRGEGK